TEENLVYEQESEPSLVYEQESEFSLVCEQESEPSLVCEQESEPSLVCEQESEPSLVCEQEISGSQTVGPPGFDSSVYVVVWIGVPPRPPRELRGLQDGSVGDFVWASNIQSILVPSVYNQIPVQMMKFFALGHKDRILQQMPCDSDPEQ
ncbi:hypothetical protein STEG23_020563, partial [Scotinomys teguina]